MHFLAIENLDATLPPNAWNLQRIPGTTELQATHTGPARPHQALLYCSQSSPVYSGGHSATSPSLSFHLLKAHLLKDVLYSGPQKPLSLTEGSGTERSTPERAWYTRETTIRGQGAAEKGTKCHGTYCQKRNAHLPNLLGSKWAGLYLHKQLDANPPVRLSFLTQKHLLIQNAFIRVNDHHTV